MMNQPNKPASADRLKTVYIIAAGVPGDRSAEQMAVYYRGIVQPYEMTFNPNGAKRFATKALAESFRKTLNGPGRFTVVEHPGRRCGTVPSDCKVGYQIS